MMSVVVDDGALRISWEQEPRWRHDDYCAILRSISGAAYDPTIRSWRCPLRTADRILEAFPHASYSYDAICAAVDARRRHIHNFASSLLAGGIRLEQRIDGVIAVGDNVSPLIQQLVDERAAELAEWLAEQQSAAAQPKRPHSRQQPAATLQAQREAELLVSSLRNAAANEQRRAAFRRAAKMTKQNEHND